MLRLRLTAMAIAAIVLSGVARAEAVVSDQTATETETQSGHAATATPAAEPAKIINSDAAIVESEGDTDGRPHISVTAIPTPNEPPPPGATTLRNDPAAAAAPAKAAAPSPTLTVQIDLAKQTMVVSENGDVKYSWPISSGAAEFPTPRGTFHAQWSAKMWYSRKYDNAPMPNAVFINGGVAIHATQHVSSLGRPASHGCIRLAPGNASTFYRMVQRHGLKMTRVAIYGTPKFRSPAIASRSPARRQYVEQPDNGFWFSSAKPYRAGPSYEPRYSQRRYRPAPPRGYYYADAPPRQYYRVYGNQRMVTNQRPQRRAYYNNGYGGYGGGGGGGWDW